VNVEEEQQQQEEEEDEGPVFEVQRIRVGGASRIILSTYQYLPPKGISIMLCQRCCYDRQGLYLSTMQLSMAS
jgi:hypothetical protein